VFVLGVEGAPNKLGLTRLQRSAIRTGSPSSGCSSPGTGHAGIGRKCGRGAPTFSARGEHNVIARTIVIWVAAMLAAASVTAQTQQPYKLHCMSTGNNAAEPLGDREGHAVLLATATCRIEGGAQDGAIVTQHLIWEIDKGTWTLIGGENVARKPGAVSISRPSGTLTLRMQDGRPAGWTASGKGVVIFAAGGAAPLSGKSYSWAARSIAPGQYVNDITPD
jgi:hypothetical protein